jgi:2-oxoisovalerate dehydrogenase E1 component
MSMATALKNPLRNAPDETVDWWRVAYLVNLSRALDHMEETRLVPEKKVLYQFSARGHDMAQILLGCRLDNPGDATCGYYRSRPLLLALGVDVADALGSAMGRAGGYSDGRDIGVVFNYPNSRGASALPMCGGVGAQYTPTAGWAQAIEYYRTVLNDPAYDDALSVVLGGDGSVASNGFWSALTIATTQKLPMLFYIEDNGFGISVPSTFQTPGGNIAMNLASWQGLRIFSGDGTDPAEAARLIDEATQYVRTERAPAMLRLTVPRLEGHSFQDTQTYKPADFVAAEWARDPLPKLRDYLVPALLSEAEWAGIEQDAQATAETAREAAEARPVSQPDTVMRNVFFEGEMQVEGGMFNHGYVAPAATETPSPEGQRINMVTAIRRTLDHELEINPRVAAVRRGHRPQRRGSCGHARPAGANTAPPACSTPALSEEGIIGRAVGMAYGRAGAGAGNPVPQICRTRDGVRSTTAARCAGGPTTALPRPSSCASPVASSRCGDPWHSQSPTRSPLSTIRAGRLPCPRTQRTP